MQNIKLSLLADSQTSTAPDYTKEKVLAHLISMTVQLKCLIVERFEWLLNLVEHVRLSLI